MRVVAAVGLLALAGCRTPTGPVVLRPAADVIRQVKYEIGKFALETSKPISTPGSCLNQFALTIDQAEIELTTTTSSSTGVSAGAQVPLSMATISAGGTVEQTLSDTQGLKLVLLPQTDGLTAAELTAPVTRVWEGEPFFRALMDVRAALIAASDQRPCVKFGEENTVAFGFAAARKASGSVELQLTLFNLGAQHSTERSAAHSVVLRFSAPRSTSFAPR